MSAIEPIEHIEHSSFPQPFTEDLPGVLRQMALLEPAPQTPYLTLTLDWRPDGGRPGIRNGRLFFDQQMDEELARAGFQPHTPPHDSLAADIEHIREFLDGQVDPAVQGIAIFACFAQGVFEPVLLGLPLSNRIVLGPTPALRVLAKLVEDEPPYLILLSDQKHATLTLVDQAARRERVDVQATGYPRKQMQGGWSQRRYQMRADERVEAFARTVAEETRRAFDQTGAQFIVLAGNEQITTTLRDDLHQSIRDNVAGMIRVDGHSNEQDVIAASFPIVEQAERDQELHAIERLENGAGPGGGSVTGPEKTLTALQTGQVMTLIMNDDFSLAGWADFSLPIFGVGNSPAQHPAGGDPSAIVPIAIEDEVVRLALQQGAEIEIVRTAPPVSNAESANDGGVDQARTEAARRLDALGGVGAILRFALTADQSTADL